MSAILVEQCNAVAVVTISRHAALNALGAGVTRILHGRHRKDHHTENQLLKFGGKTS